MQTIHLKGEEWAMNGSSGTSTTTVDRMPDWVQNDYATMYLNRAKKLFLDKETFDVYDGQTYADQNDNELDGIANLADRGRNGDILITKGKTHIKSILDGDFLDGSESEFQETLDDIINNPKKTLFDDIMPKLGGSLYHINDLSGRNLSKELVSDSKYYIRTSKIVYADNYKDEREAQERILPLGIEYGRQDVVDAEVLRTAGLYQREYNQGALEDAYKVYYEEQTAYIRKLDVLGNAIRSIMGTQTAIDRPYYRPSPITGMMGGAMAGAAVGTMFAPGVGTVAGAIGGVLLGGLGSA